MTLPWDEAGKGEPAVVFLHAGVADRSMWRETLGWLAEEGWRGVAFDLPGFGEAPVAPGPQAPWDDVLAAMQALGLGSSVLVGNSFGAAVALRVAAVAPAAARGLILVSPPPLEDDEPSEALREAWEAEEAALQDGDVEAAVEAVVSAWLVPDAPDALRRRVAAMQRRAFEQQLAAPAEAADAPDPLVKWPGALDGLRVPVLALTGEHDMPDFREEAVLLARRLPVARHAVIAGAGHLAPLETPDAFRELLLEFLRDLRP
jgi:pimeloyl-ACP methyl ester carboxylesterase